MKYAIGLSEHQTRRVVQQSIRSQAQAIIEPADLPDLTLLGFVASGDDSIFTVELTGARRHALDRLVGRMVGVQLFCGEKYLFNTRVVTGPTWHAAEQLTLACPQSIQVVQRRRFWRAQLAPSSAVTVQWRGHRGPEQADAALLNVSSDGLACKLNAGAALVLTPGRRVQVEFLIPPARAPFVFEAIVRNAAPSSDDGCIVGVEFQINAVDQAAVEMQNTLRELLYCPQSNSMEVASP